MIISNYFRTLLWSLLFWAVSSFTLHAQTIPLYKKQVVMDAGHGG
jgi:hypothetical protein